MPAGRPLTDALRREIAELAKRPDSEIDLTDMPEWTDEMFARAVQGQFYRPLKSQLTVRVDNDILAWLRAKGRGYQTRINAILRQAMPDDVAGR
ncbi:MAG TPA: BrnA antitoxin family protein [Caulobacteraceae bacterium]